MKIRAKDQDETEPKHMQYKRCMIRDPNLWIPILCLIKSDAKGSEFDWKGGLCWAEIFIPANYAKLKTVLR